MGESQSELWQKREERIQFLKQKGYDSAWLSFATDRDVAKAYWEILRQDDEN